MTNPSGANISVCLLTYNHAHIIESTLRSIREQSVAGYEIIVSDDCSTDGTWEKVVEIAATDSRIKAIRTSGNCGMPGNANFAVAHAQRPFIALLHHDDICRHDLLEKWAGVLERHADVAFVFNQYQVHGTDSVDAEPFADERIDGRWLLNKYLFPGWGCVVRGTAMIRRDAWMEVGGMREQFNLLADIDMWMRLAMCWNAGYVAEPVMAIRNQRPAYYPEIYQEIDFSWSRQRYLYEIHAANRLAYLDLKTISGLFQWRIFRIRLSRESMKWLAYAVVRKKRAMIASSGDGATPYDLWPLRLARALMLKMQRED